MRISDWSSDVCSSDLMLDIDEGQWDRVVDLNLKWTFFAMQAAARAMAARGGSIVNLSSRSGSQPCPPTAHYGAAKAGVDSLTDTAALDWGQIGRAHVRTPVTNAPFVCRLLLEKQKNSP